MSALSGGVLAKFVVTVPAPVDPLVLGYNVRFVTAIELDHPADFAQYILNGGAPVSLGVGPVNPGDPATLTGYNSPWIFLGIGKTLEFDVSTVGAPNDATLSIQGFQVTPVPEPATMALNGLVLVGAAAGWAWKRRSNKAT